ncbi:MAG: iron-containing alcohol dehydrogenase [Desulfobacteraceae bacterium]|nr:MAG: iron-containing alcohol dehydrogenase [Desulfobacteraceae bacterium]
MERLITVEGVKRILFGKGSLRRLGAECASLGSKRVLLVMDKELAQSAFVSAAQESLKENTIDFIPYFQVTPEPSPSLADEGAEIARREKANGVVGLGGGSTMDVAKAVAVLANNPGKATDYIGLGLVRNPGLPSVMVPTTAGTGSEVTFTAVFTMRETKSKGGINSPYLYPSAAILDPEMTFSLPPYPTAYTGMDALTHAIESFTSLQAHFLSETISFKAIEIIARNLRGAVYEGSNMIYRESMLEGSYMAGLGLAMAGVGAVHALAYPLGALFNIPHGIANAVMLPYVLAYNYPGNMAKFTAIARAMGEEVEGFSLREAAMQASESVAALSRDIGIPATLKELQIPFEAIPEMAQGAMKVARPLANNPRPITVDSAAEIYRLAFKGEY